MAVILNISNQKQTLSYLNAYHCIGRSITNVDTVIDALEVSRMHAVIEWLDKQWFIRDLSNNGTWVNTQKLVKDDSHKLNVGDKLYFGASDTHGFVVQDLSPPQNMLLAVEPSTNKSAHCSTESPIILSDYNLLPSEQQPEIALFYVASKDQWYKEFIDDVEGRAYPVANLEYLVFNSQNWQLKLNALSENTIQLAKPSLLADQIKYRFNLSQNEENTELTITADDQEFCLSNKAHHYLTLSLARHRDDDAKKGIDEYSQGWRFPEIIAKELGYDIQLLNTHVSRAKKQLVDMLNGACDGNVLIERKGKQIRFSGSFYRIYHGGKLTVNRGYEPLSLTVLHG